MKAFFLILFLSVGAFAKDVPATVHLPDDVPVYSAPTVSLRPSPKFKMGVDLEFGNFVGGQGLSSLAGVGFLGDYKLDRHWGLEGRLAFLTFDLSTPYYYSGWGWGRPCYSYAETVTYNQVEATFGPTYRILTGKFSPVLGAMLGYTHRYFTQPTYGYSTVGYSGNSDSLSVGGLVGLDYQVTKEFSIGADLRYMVPVSYSANSYYYPSTRSPVEGLNYYVGSINLKFIF